MLSCKKPFRRIPQLSCEEDRQELLMGVRVKLSLCVSDRPRGDLSEELLLLDLERLCVCVVIEAGNPGLCKINFCHGSGEDLL